MLKISIFKKRRTSRILNIFVEYFCLQNFSTLGFQSKLLDSGPLFSSDLLQFFSTFFSLVQSSSQSSSFSWSQISRLEALSSVEFLEFLLLTLVQNGQSLGNVLSDNSDFVDLVTAVGDFGNLQSGEFFSEVNDLVFQFFSGVFSEGSSSEFGLLLFSHFLMFFWFKFCENLNSVSST